MEIIKIGYLNLCAYFTTHALRSAHVVLYHILDELYTQNPTLSLQGVRVHIRLLDIRSLVLFRGTSLTATYVSKNLNTPTNVSRRLEKTWVAGNIFMKLDFRGNDPEHGPTIYHLTHRRYHAAYYRYMQSTDHNILDSS